ncbi:hypothetical protein JCM10512_3483 [Bacteroides reticulotermitis JCM 10512]|uniref:Uncharacterized protein n=1 Tax=Bacteroides reticulotermitis JCM 10512 TaxID=1445607 RepID=W4UV34_9BACE|nr:hypothetical protein JCM10512_3483 [Bacteroides reticulotermitis JCM 10512]
MTYDEGFTEKVAFGEQGDNRQGKRGFVCGDGDRAVTWLITQIGDVKKYSVGFGSERQPESSFIVGRTAGKQQAIG